MLDQFLDGLPAQAANPKLLVGNDTRDDAAVYQIADDQAIVATTDFFMPIVDDPRDFGRISAANALSDVWAMGGKPIMALAIAGIPVGKISDADVGKIFGGGIEMCAEAGIPVAGGHTIDAPEPIYGLAVVGLVDPAKLRMNDSAKAGDTLILGKPLGVGILGAAANKAELDPNGYRDLVETATRLNTIGADLAELSGVHAMTDLTGFGLLGHVFEMCGKSHTATIDFAKLPILESAVDYVQRGFVTGSGGRNWASYGEHVTLPDGLEDWRKNILVDPQTSGGLLVACSPEETDKVLKMFAEKGYVGAAVIGEMGDGTPHVTVV